MRSKFDLTLAHPYLNAAGSLGMAPDPHASFPFSRLGAFVTNPISWKPHSPAHSRNCLLFPGGFLLHTGFPNPGFQAAVRANRQRWERSAIPIIVHLLAGRHEQITQMVHVLEELEGVMAIELGFPPDLSSGDIHGALEAAVGELPLIARLPLDRALDLAPQSIKQGAAAISLGAPRGSLPAPPAVSAGWLPSNSLEKALPSEAHSLEVVSGRLYGPALYPLALQAVLSLARAGLPVIGAGGIYSMREARQMLEAGALAVQFDSVLWRDGRIPD